MRPFVKHGCNHINRINCTLSTTKTTTCILNQRSIAKQRKFTSNSNPSSKNEVSTQGIKSRPPWNILFFGTDNIALKTLSKLHLNKIRPAASGTQTKVVNHIEAVTPPNKGLAPGPVQSYCLQNKIPVHHPLPSIKEWNVPPSSNKEPFDLAVVVSFGYLIPTHVLDSFPLGGINMHPSLLPKYRGAAPIYHTLLNNETETGISVIELAKNKFDVGNILLQIPYKIDPLETYTVLTDKLAELGSNSILKVLHDLIHFKSNAIPQSNEGASKAPKIYREMGFIKWTQQSSNEVWILWRALGDTVGIHTKYNFNQKQVRLFKLLPPGTMMSYRDPHKYDSIYSPGMLKFDKNQNLLFIRCASGWIACSELQIEGRNRCDALSFVNGYNFKNLKVPSEQHKFVELQ